MKHTATPYSITHQTGSDFSWDIYSKQSVSGFPVATCGQQKATDDICQANAEFIVRACNSHSALVEACKSLIRSYEYHCPDAKDQSLAIKNAKQALAQAGE